MTFVYFHYYPTNGAVRTDFQKRTPAVSGFRSLQPIYSFQTSSPQTQRHGQWFPTHGDVRRHVPPPYPYQPSTGDCFRDVSSVFSSLTVISNFPRRFLSRLFPSVSQFRRSIQGRQDALCLHGGPHPNCWGLVPYRVEYHDKDAKLGRHSWKICVLLRRSLASRA